MAVLIIAASAALVCSDDGSAPRGPSKPTRTYRMGFSGIPPSNDIDLAIAAILMWSERADAAIMSFELPWDSLLAGVRAETLVGRDQAGLANFYRA